MLKEIQTARLSEKRNGGIPKGVPNGSEGSSLGRGGPTRGTKRTCQSK